MQITGELVAPVTTRFGPESERSVSKWKTRYPPPDFKCIANWRLTETANRNRSGNSIANWLLTRHVSCLHVLQYSYSLISVAYLGLEKRRQSFFPSASSITLPPPFMSSRHPITSFPFRSSPIKSSQTLCLSDCCYSLTPMNSRKNRH